MHVCNATLHRCCPAQPLDTSSCYLLPSKNLDFGMMSDRGNRAANFVNCCQQRKHNRTVIYMPYILARRNPQEAAIQITDEYRTKIPSTPRHEYIYRNTHRMCSIVECYPLNNVLRVGNHKATSPRASSLSGHSR